MVLTADQQPTNTPVKPIHDRTAVIPLQHNMRAVPHVRRRRVMRRLRVPQTVGAVRVRDVHQRGAADDVRQLIERVVGAGLHTAVDGVSEKQTRKSFIILINISRYNFRFFIAISQREGI